MSTPPLFLVDALPSAGELVLDGAEGRHAAEVRRIRPGETVLVGDGRGALARCEVLDVGRGQVTLAELGRRSVPAPPLRVTVAQALVKGDRGELAVELATEAGADAVVPWRAARCVARWDEGPRGAKALQRWRTTAREASKQARRAWTCAVDDPRDTAALAATIRAADAAVVLDEGGGRGLDEITLPGKGDLVLVVGPEGGVTPDEAAQLSDAGAARVRLGAEVLRASTAAAVALGALGVLTRRWKVGRSGRNLSVPGDERYCR